MGIYHDLLRIISNPFKKLKQNILFCTPIGIGAVISGILFVIAFRQLFDSYEKATYLLFVGLIAGSIPIVLKEVRKIGFKPHYLLGAIGAFALAIAMGIFATGIGLVSGDATSISNLPGFAIGGIAAGVTALIPGMSLSTVLIILGVYAPMIYAAEALLHLELSNLVPIMVFFICVIIGLVSTARGIKYIFKKFPGFANTTVLGFQAGSLLSIMYQSHQIIDTNFTWLLGGTALAIGLGIAILFITLGKVMNKTEEIDSNHEAR
jgi:putative membrane protein